MFSGTFETMTPLEPARTDCELTSSPWPALRSVAAGPDPAAGPGGAPVPCDCCGSGLGPTLYR